MILIATEQDVSVRGVGHVVVDDLLINPTISEQTSEADVVAITSLARAIGVLV